MLTKKFVLIAVIVSLFAPSMPIFAQDAGALLDLLVKKRLIRSSPMKRRSPGSPSGSYGCAMVALRVRNDHVRPSQTQTHRVNR